MKALAQKVSDVNEKVGNASTKMEAVRESNGNAGNREQRDGEVALNQLTNAVNTDAVNFQISA